MRWFWIAALACAAMFAPAAFAQLGDNPFPVARGSALPPPAAETRAGQSAPAEGAGPGGIDFGRWRGADPAAYGANFEAQLRARYASQTGPEIRADLEANGFACQEQQGGRLHCRIEITDSGCALDWYAVIERPGEAIIAGFDRMCLPAQ